MEWADWRPDAEDLDFRGITSRYSDIPGLVLDESRVPEAFRHLLPLARHWAVGDDRERANLMWLTDTEELRRFVDAVWTQFEAIDAWCGSRRGLVPVPDEVVLFDMMLEAAADAVAIHADEPDEAASS